jgi:hypothetical protein
MAKQAEHNLGRIPFICAFQDKVLFMVNPKNFTSVTFGIGLFSWVMFISEYFKPLEEN